MKFIERPGPFSLQARHKIMAREIYSTMYCTNDQQKFPGSGFTYANIRLDRDMHHGNTDRSTELLLPKDMFPA